MAEAMVDIDQESKLADTQQDNEEATEEENGETDASLLAGLNLVLILSFYSLHPEECSNLDETREMEPGNYDKKAKHGVSRSNFQTRKRQENQFPAVARQTSKLHTKIRDSRHCRRF